MWIASSNACKTCAVVLYELTANLCIENVNKSESLLPDSGKLQSDLHAVIEKFHENKVQISEHPQEQ